MVRGGASFHFVTGGIEDVVKRARAAAGDRDVCVAGGAEVARQALAAGLLDELQLHVVPVLLGGGLRLFGSPGTPPTRLRQIRVISSAHATHLRFRVVGAAAQEEPS